MPSLGHIILAVSDFERTEKFYDSFMLPLGFTVGLYEKEESGAIKAYHCGEHGLYISWDAKREHKDFVRDVGLDHIAVRVENRELVDGSYNRLMTMKCEITRSPREYPEYTRDYYAFYFRDPDGIPLEIAYY